MSLSPDLAVGRLFQFERSGKGPVDAEHAVITSVNDPNVGLQWKLRSLHFSRNGTAALDVFVRLRSEPSKDEYLVKKLALGSGEADAPWLPGDDTVYVPHEAELSIQFAAGASEEWRILVVGEIVSRA